MGHGARTRQKHTVQCACDGVLHRVNTGLISRNPNSIAPEVMKRLGCPPARVWICRACQGLGSSGRSFLASYLGQRSARSHGVNCPWHAWAHGAACRPAAVQHECRREVRAVDQADPLIQAWQLGRQRQFTAAVVAQLASSSAWLSDSSRHTVRTGGRAEARTATGHCPAAGGCSHRPGADQSTPSTTSVRKHVSCSRWARPQACVSEAKQMSQGLRPEPLAGLNAAAGHGQVLPSEC
jgi:hypothetical protein